MSKPTFEERRNIVKKAFGAFPMRIVFYLRRDKDGSYGIQFHKSKKKINLENYKLSQLQMTSLDGTVSTPLEVADIISFTELEERLDYLSEIWVEDEK